MCVRCCLSGVGCMFVEGRRECMTSYVVCEREGFPEPLIVHSVSTSFAVVRLVLSSHRVA